MPLAHPAGGKDSFVVEDQAPTLRDADDASSAGLCTRFGGRDMEAPWELDGYLNAPYGGVKDDAFSCGHFPRTTGTAGHPGRNLVRIEDGETTKDRARMRDVVGDQYTALFVFRWRELCRRVGNSASSYLGLGFAAAFRTPAGRVGEVRCGRRSYRDWRLQ